MRHPHPSTKKLGIIGGAGPYASALLYQNILEGYYNQPIRGSVPEITLVNYPFTRGLSLEESQQSSSLLCTELQRCIDALSQYGASLLMIACNTLHTFLPFLNLRNMSLISLPKAVIRTALSKELRRPLLLGTPTTLKSDLYHHDFLNLIYPNGAEQRIVDRVIDRILSGIVQKEDSQALSNLITGIQTRENIDSVVLGCTDLPVLHQSYTLTIPGIPILDSIRIPANQIINQLYCEEL